MNLQKLYSIFLLPFIVSLLTMIMVTGCSDDDKELQSQYGYVQFKLYKKTIEEGAATRAKDKLDLLSEAQKINVVMLHEGVTISQTLRLNSYSDENAEFGLRSDKLQLLVGTYKIVGYYLYDGLDEELLAGSVGEDDEFTIVSGGLQQKDLTAEAVSRGMVTFKLIKDGLTTRANEEEPAYLFQDIQIIDVTITNTFNHTSTTIENLKVSYKEDYKEHQNPDNPNDKYMDIGTASCDSVIWLPQGTYKVTGYTVYKKSGGSNTRLETQPNISGESFIVENNKKTEAQVPIQLSETAEYIKDYIALKEIWKALKGEKWSYYGEGTPAGATWNFNKEMDMWGDQPGVGLNDEGRVVSLTLEGFGAEGRVPDAIGQLTELKVLSFGSHNEKINGRLFGPNGITPDMTDAQKQKMRMHYKEHFLDYDPRENMSDLLKDGINRNPEHKKIKTNNRIQLKDTQIGQTTNNITFISKAIMRLTKLQQLYIANSPIKAEDICEKWENAESEYAKEYETESSSWNWSQLEDLTDIELYNCPKLDRLPSFLKELPEMQLLNIACNKGIDGEQLKDDWQALADADVGKKLQILYLGYNNLEAFPPSESLAKMEKLGLLDCIQNQLKGKLEAFGSHVKLATLTLDYNEITEIPDNFCGFTDQVETLSFAHNKLKYIPNIFNASSVYVMGSVDFSYNMIGSDNGKNINCDEFNGINASTISLSNNEIKNFPTELFSSGSPITTIDLSNNLMTEIPENSLKSKDGNYKNTHLLSVIDLRFNKLTKLSDDFRATTLPYLQNMDVSYNCFSKFPTEPLNSSQLQAFGIRHQRDAEGNRILREWPEGITTCPSLIQLQIGSNDIRKVNETMTPQLWILDIQDNPNISIDLTSVCPYIEAGLYKLFYDKTQDIRGCDALDIKR